MAFMGIIEVLKEYKEEDGEESVRRVEKGRKEGGEMSVSSFKGRVGAQDQLHLEGWLAGKELVH